MDEAARGSDAVFVGEAGPTDGTGQGAVTLFRLETIFKGTPGSGAIFHGTEGAACGLRFTEGTTYTVFAYENDGRLETNLCTREGSIPAEKLDLSPLPSPPASRGPSDGTVASRPWYIIALRILVALFVPVFLFISMWWRRRRQEPSSIQG
jgi:hypothetical protein